MARPELEAASFSLAMLAWIGTIVCCWLPTWRVKEISEHTFIWEGLWNLCEADKFESLKCMIYNSRPVLPQDLQVSRVLVVTCIFVTWLGLLLYMIGDERIWCVSSMKNEEKIMMAASVLFLGVGLLLLVSVSWVTHNVILGIANPQIVSQSKPEMGASLYLGWLSSLLLLLAGALLAAAHMWCEAPANNEQPSRSEGSGEGPSSDNSRA
ncbi:claudin-13-like [Mesocricetus auratus]|uniref:Claudin-13-like n=1 Tax=Mesocricetus auratus TaxID=10036 RepID=A0ABM2W9D3_MESAU|nr:claudin-13-like [Mesocricetus auratus]